MVVCQRFSALRSARHSLLLQKHAPMYLAAVLLMAVLIFAPLCVHAQRAKSPGIPSPANASPRYDSIRVSDGQGPVFLSGKVVISDGSELTEPAAIRIVCESYKRIETYTGSRGDFSFQLGKDHGRLGQSDVSELGVESSAGTDGQQHWRDCEVQAVLAGFSSDSILLNRLMTSLQSTDIGKIELRPLEHVEGFTISVTTAAAPGNAKKAFDKGRELEKKQKWDAAERELQKAVSLYPKYAIAWFELGRLQFQKNDSAGARHSFEQSAAADPHYANPYLGFAHLALKEKQWQQLVEITGKLIALNPVNFPEAWLLNCVGHYSLRKYDTAEASAREGIKIDEVHQFPKLQYMLGIVLIEKRNFAEASDMMRQYLQLSSAPDDIAEAQKQLGEIARLSGTAATASPSPQK